MTRTPTDTRLAELSANVRQMCEPIHIAIRGQIHTRPSLLDELRQPGEHHTTGDTDSTRGVPESRPPGNLTRPDTLSTIYVEMARWHASLDLPSPPAYAYGCQHTTCHLALLERGHPGPVCGRASIKRIDWHKAVLRQFVGVWPDLSPGQQEWLDADIENWWELAARTVDWRPSELRRLQ